LTLDMSKYDFEYVRQSTKCIKCIKCIKHSKYTYIYKYVYIYFM
jgi:hypothetical protein